MRITVITKEGRPLELEVTPSRTVATLKAAIEQAEARPLTFAGQVLPESATLSECGIQEGSTLREMHPKGWFAARRNKRGTPYVPSSSFQMTPFDVATVESRHDALQRLLPCCPEGWCTSTKDDAWKLLHYVLEKSPCPGAMVVTLVPYLPGSVIMLKRNHKASFHIAFERSCLGALEALLLHCPEGAKVKDANGRTRFHETVCLFERSIAVKDSSSNQDYITKNPTFLFAQGALELLLRYCPSDAKEPDNNGRTAFHLAAWKDDEDAMQLLLRYCPEGAKVKDVEKWTPMHHAARFASKSLLCLLQVYPEGGKDVDTDGRTPFHLAAWNGYRTHLTVAALLQYCPEAARMKDRYGETPFHYAAERNHYDVLKALMVRFPMGVHDRNLRGQTPMDVALENGHRSLLELLLIA